MYGLLMIGFSPTTIVEKLRLNDKTNRSYLLKLRDVFKICRVTGVGDVSRGELHQEDSTSVHMFVENNLDNGNVIMYKPNRVKLVEYPELNGADFAIAIMTQFQLEQLDQLSNEFSVICVVATHCVGHGYKMITVLTVDEFYQGMPLAFRSTIFLKLSKHVPVNP